MDDVKDLLHEAVGSYEPRCDQEDVERRARQQAKSRRMVAATVAIALFAGAGWFAYSAFRSVQGSVAGSESGTYLLDDFEVSPRFEPGTGDLKPDEAEVTFVARWSSPQFPGDHECVLRVRDAQGTEIGSLPFQNGSLSEGSRSGPLVVHVTGSLGGATADGSCSEERLDTPVAYDISEVRLGVGDALTVSFVVGWPDGLGEGDYPGTNACTVALLDGIRVVTQQHFTLAVPEGPQEVGFDPMPVPASGVEASVVCDPFVRPGVFPEPKPLSGTPAGSVPLGELPEVGVVVGSGDSVLFLDLDGRIVETLRGYVVAGNPGSPGVWLQQDDEYFSFDAAQDALVPVTQDEARDVMYDEGPEPRLVPPPGVPGYEGTPDGHWRYAFESESGVTLAQWSGECEVPNAYWIDDTGTALLVTGESSISEAPESLALGWSPEGDAVVFLPVGYCGGSADPPGIYLYSSPGDGRFIFETKQGASADMWGNGR